MIARADWPLLLLAFAPEHRLTPVQMQKALFLLSEELRVKAADGHFYEFVPHHFGPFDVKIYQDLTDLATRGLVDLVPSRSYSGRDYALSPQGLPTAAKLHRRIATEEAAYAKKVTEWVTSLSFSQLVNAIYKKYPKMRENSVFR